MLLPRDPTTMESHSIPLCYPSRLSLKGSSSNEARPHVPNPKLTTEDFGQLWTDKQYQDFRSAIHKYKELIDAAYDAGTKAESIVAWREVFGDEFAKGDTVVTKSMAEDEGIHKSFLMETAAHLNGLVD